MRIIRVYDGEKISDYNALSFKTFSAGDLESDNYRFIGTDTDRVHLSFFIENDSWLVSRTSREGTSTIEVVDGQYLVASRKYNQWVMLFSLDITREEKYSFDRGDISIGRSDDNTIILNDSSVSRHQAVIHFQGETCLLTDMGSRDGTFLNGKKVNSAIVNPGDIIVISTYYFTFDGKRIVSCVPDFLTNGIDTEKQSTRPSFKRSPRLSYADFEKVIRIQPPPGIGSDPEFYWSLSVIGMATSGLRFISRKKKYNKAQKMLLEMYNEYLTAMAKEMDDFILQKSKALNYVYPSTDECIKFALDRENRLWERSPTDEDFMRLRIGRGRAPSGMKIEAPGRQLSLSADPLTEAANRLADARKTMDGVPVYCDLTHGNSVGVIGDRSVRRELVNNMIVQASALHSYDELRLSIFFSKSEGEDWDWIKWLPHVFDNERAVRFMANNKSDAEQIIKCFDDEFRQRKQKVQEGNSNKTIFAPFYLFVIADISLVERTSLLKYLLENNEDMQIGVIFLSEEMRQLPKECQTIIDLTQGEWTIYNKRDALHQQAFVADRISGALYERYSRALAPLRLDSTMSAESKFPDSITFLEGYGVKRPSQLDTVDLWGRHDAYKSMAVPLGIRDNGEPFYFDILAGHHGPHGVVVGTTGSGKTEAIQSWILSMSTRFSPSDVSFVLVDFKGSGLIDPFVKLPHLAGAISNLDTGIGRNLIALESELQRREELFSQYGVNKISKYNRVSGAPLPYLFVIFDEFADFKRNFPEYMPQISKFYEQGRSLGIWFILMSQKPDPLTSFIANAEFKWCLRVKGTDDSKAILGTGDAARPGLPPGRLFVSADNGAVYEEIQTYFAGAPYRPYSKNPYMKTAPISVVDLIGRRLQYKDDETTGFKSEKSEINAIVEYLDKYVTDNGLPRAKKVWTDELPKLLCLYDVVEKSFDGQGWHKLEAAGLSPSVGLADDPRNQAQFSLALQLSEDGHVAVFGAPGSGKTVFLQTLVMSLALTYSPDDVHIYIMDFGGWSLNIFSLLPHIGGIANDNETEKIQKLSEMLSEELLARKRTFGSMGVTSIEDYREATQKHIPYIVLVVDNFAPVLSLYPALDKFFIDLSREGANYGIILVTTANSLTSLPFKVSQNIRNKLALHMTDRTDYVGIVGKTDGLEPDDFPGRGLARCDYPVEFQTAMPGRGRSQKDILADLRETCKRMDEVWHGNRPAPIPVLPEIIPYGTVSARGIAIGLSTQKLDPVGIDFSTSHCLIISGTPQSGKSNLLKIISKQLSAIGAKLIAVDSPDRGLASLREIVSDYCVEGMEIDDSISRLIPELQQRKSLHDKNSEETFPLIAIVIDDLSTCFDSISDQTAKRLEMIARIGAGLGVLLIIAGNNRDINKLFSQGESLTIAMITLGQAILLGESFNAHPSFNADIPYSRKNEPLREFEAYAIQNGKAIRFKVMNEV